MARCVHETKLIMAIANLSHVIRKPAFYLCENKGALFPPLFSLQSTPLLSKSEITSVEFVSDLVGNPEDRFSHDAPHYQTHLRYDGMLFKVARLHISLERKTSYEGPRSSKWKRRVN